ncbi:DUF6883 domain-containing protein [Gloeobacter violaceus]|uniref:Gll3995 protein n=1 Tax=Gloeobacter violaceus (strain ATCC 29082 / PCC 7421) TaxID=251221 RepID=Q7NE85_GLOVI|nr:DUF6883 domain-containing protein [Gloeobacter violaceus]BAC91936.1 gll3995 [Gloeobacter violaceus PCC 7421]
MQLPNPEQAVVDTERKLRGYCLNLMHDTGRHKARVFAATLGLTAANAELLRDAILAAIVTHKAIERGSTLFGSLYTVDFGMTGPAGRATVRTNWLVENGTDFARLTSCFVMED